MFLSAKLVSSHWSLKSPTGNMRMRHFALYKQQSPTRQSRNSQVALTRQA